MGAISLTGGAIYSQNINNFSGELFRVGGQRTPFLSATGGKEEIKKKGQRIFVGSDKPGKKKRSKKKARR